MSCRRQARNTGEERKIEVLNEELMEQVLEAENLQAAYLAVKANKGAAGVDGISTGELAGHLREHWPGIKRKLEESRYKPDPVKTVVIPKAGGGERSLGIPTVTDRFIQQALIGKLDGIFDPQMSESSFGFRRGRSAHQAVTKAKMHVVEEGKNWIVDIDIRAFFDQIDHDILMRKIAGQIRDKRILKLIGSYLRGGRQQADGRITRDARKGTPQGGPLSPLLGNVYLDALDKELEARGLSFVRYADDVTIYTRSERSATRVLESLIRWLSKNLKLEVNREKSRVRPPDEGSFLGFRITRGKIAVSEKSIERFKKEVREIWNARWSVCSGDRIKRWQQYAKGWWNYFRLSEQKWEYEDLSGWVRRHMRKCIWQCWHNWKGRSNALRKLGATGKSLRLAHSSRGAWRVSRALNSTLTNKRLRSWGMEVPEDFDQALSEMT